MHSGISKKTTKKPGLTQPEGGASLPPRLHLTCLFRRMAAGLTQPHLTSKAKLFSNAC